MPGLFLQPMVRQPLHARQALACLISGYRPNWATRRYGKVTPHADREQKFLFLSWKVMKRKWTQREYEAFKQWEKGFDRPIWWMLAVAICLPMFGILLGAMTK
jgi:hypothetical protein